MKLLAMLKGLFVKIPKLIDPWEAAGNTYVIWYRSGFEQLAAKLSTDSLTVSLRYNPDDTSIELYSNDGTTVMKFNVHGSMGTPYEAIVVSRPLDEQMKEYIIEMFKMKVRSTPSSMRILFNQFPQESLVSAS